MKKIYILIFVLSFPELLSLSFSIQKKEIQMHIRIFEVPAWQNVKIETNVSGVIYTYIKGGDITLRFPKEPLIIQSDISNTKDLTTAAQIEIIKNNFPAAILDNKYIKVHFISEELVVVNSSKLEIKEIAGYFSNKSNIQYSLLIYPINLTENLFKLHLTFVIKLESKEKKILNKYFILNLLKLNVIGVPSYIGKGRRGNVYFLAILFKQI